MTVESPCVNVCKLDAARVCIGCGRSVAEIRDWKGSSDGAKRRVVERIRRQGYPRPDAALAITESQS
ncbi:MAG: DUF1289 domain-containing protein [Telmatospirillum sp.]|nr:DUF1289 domain-containing protein [Telmatospirillum sp.]